jgi:hypothetical protein
MMLDIPKARRVSSNFCLRNLTCFSSSAIFAASLIVGFPLVG